MTLSFEEISLKWKSDRQSTMSRDQEHGDRPRRGARHGQGGVLQCAPVSHAIVDTLLPTVAVFPIESSVLTGRLYAACYTSLRAFTVFLAPLLYSKIYALSAAGSFPRGTVRPSSFTRAILFAYPNC